MYFWLSCIGIRVQHFCLREYSKYKETAAAAGAAVCWEALPVHFVSPFVWKCITLSELDFFSPLHSSLNISYSFCASVGCRDSGSSGFLISPSVSRLFEALSEGQNQIHPNEKAIVDLFLHLVPPYSFSPRKHLSFFVLLEAYETIGAHLCPEENSPALSKAVLFSTRPWQSVFLKAFGRL